VKSYVQGKITEVPSDEVKMLQPGTATGFLQHGRADIQANDQVCLSRKLPAQQSGSAGQVEDRVDALPVVISGSRQQVGIVGDQTTVTARPERRQPVIGRFYQFVDELLVEPLPGAPTDDRIERIPAAFWLLDPAANCLYSVSRITAYIRQNNGRGRIGLCQ